jgi:hypothetical protein
MKARFTIREILWMILVVALAMGWLVDHNTWNNADRYAVREVPNYYLSNSPSKTRLEIVDRKSGMQIHAEKP